MFGHPVPFAATLAVFVVLFAYMSTVQVAPDILAAPTENFQRTVMMFPAAGALAAACAMVCGCLVMWIGQHTDKPNTTWTAAPPVWARPGADSDA
jgi:hypothetical protein